ncbi:RNA-directed DNA polymerase, eukaryota, reverse transcriptase zinc-binding domain protein [Tanacetum coccineum]
MAKDSSSAKKKIGGFRRWEYKKLKKHCPFYGNGINGVFFNGGIDALGRKMLSLEGLRLPMEVLILSWFVPYKKGLWKNILDSCLNCEQLDPSFSNLMVKKIYNGNKTSFWYDNWISECGPLRCRFPRLFALETYKSCLVSDRWVFVDGIWQPNWAWNRQPSGRSDGEVSSLLNLLNGLVLSPSQDDRWVWSLEHWCFFYRLPTRSNLARRGIQIHNPSCVFCNDNVESRDHCFYTCPKIQIIWLKIWSWWKAPPTFHPSFDDILTGGGPGFSLDKRKSKIFHAVCMTFIWYIWAWRNKIIHATSIEEANSARHDDIFPAVQRQSLFWISNRVPSGLSSWNSWIQHLDVADEVS